MRLRKKWWARPEMEVSNLSVMNPGNYKGKWMEQFENKNPIYLELGCGRGKFLCEQAQNNIDINYIGIDLKDEVLIYTLRKIQQKELKNVRVIPMNITGIGDIFDTNEISRIYINFCNPWPKKRHNKRRLTHTRFLTVYKKFLKKGSEIWFKTDDVELFNESQEYFKENGFAIEYLTYDLHNSNFHGNITTEYEEKFTSIGMQTMFLISKML
ncbi:MAG: tRNA (guanosine(46)-N7)-methyltransferase TrmB [Clostridium sp.]|jgi:tRNA (guanine-N7-)-methyltransferase|uniref:tRNA (guanosine(46)-N7)-methyltransferase TrmB n=1 Tax=Clostridium sp. TaxID=1506 RepID=UPI0025C618BE|nr:tRNA (guanosine(46)-N7)-methyltransferase TrmB [Clostridium sp.]MCH3963050.1 tRNA (guanosine(46)-N7)-methyltransferase TrmB [Clostridium sp.]MCI1716487.1 tRNA (guanosine(46)-N7)-methyltransferase TrmB [Clostridium sp.]MCI1800827.1 tRNA (guanosine(46)-N7)-methyltransferase TrmB [Clostridium sp.]MCI1814518.1 tRNA (guanosine(46)-N7)-methyltransferase TrmB [Clostridium sp.]MCI1871428.1 tRNA (guanosine(46)-N7)-methyltransferase TrmB [Clostridium sp.]